ncbi:SLC13 family permease [Rhizobium sp. BK418]|uniref:SLC13 family permease n=1 Tax=Rhizobium sp. BK418 TaxID=2512120 RepID=UPI0010CF8A3B|nr:SLC13 family permease [Rhizobium sp. BK418]TCS00935.1 TrkA family protein [Rhizobium sp. BK418]
MNYQLALVLFLLLTAVTMFAINKPRFDAVGLLMLVAMPFTGVITMNEALAGFSDSSVILIAALFVIGEGLVRTGVARQVGDWLDAKAGASESRLLALLMVAVAGLGAFMSSTAVVAIFIPVVLRISQNRSLPPGRLMMPLSVAALISGMMTLIATAPNLIVNAELSRHGIEAFSFFSFTPFGLPVLALGIVYMLVARKTLTAQATDAGKSPHRFTLGDWIERYNLAARERRFLVTEHSAMVGKRLDELQLRRAGVNLLAIERGSGLSAEVLRPMPHTRIEAGDTLLADVNGSETPFEALCQTYSLEVRPLQQGTIISMIGLRRSAWSRSSCRPSPACLARQFRKLNCARNTVSPRLG